MSDTDTNVDVLDGLISDSDSTTTESSESNESDNTASDNTESTETVAGTETTESTEKKYTNIVSEVSEGSDTDGLMTAPEFARYLTLRNIRASIANGGDGGLDDVVDQQNIYTAMKAKTHPLPVVMVGDSAYLPVESAEAAWDARPERGTGTSTGSKLGDEDLLKAAASVRQRVTKLAKYMEGAKERLGKLEDLQTKRNRQLVDRFGGTAESVWSKVDEWESANEVSESDESDSTD